MLLEVIAREGQVHAVRAACPGRPMQRTLSRLLRNWNSTNVGPLKSSYVESRGRQTWSPTTWSARPAWRS